MGLNTKCRLHGNLHPDCLCPDKDKMKYFLILINKTDKKNPKVVRVYGIVEEQPFKLIARKIGERFQKLVRHYCFWNTYDVIMDRATSFEEIENAYPEFDGWESCGKIQPM